MPSLPVQTLKFAIAEIENAPLCSIPLPFANLPFAIRRLAIGYWHSTISAAGWDIAKTNRTAITNSLTPTLRNLPTSTLPLASFPSETSTP